MAQRQLLTSADLLADQDTISLLRELMGLQMWLAQAKRGEREASGFALRRARRTARRIRVELARREAARTAVVRDA